eukprot:1151640-Pelagomonas_calceolata.AAC.1
MGTAAAAAVAAAEAAAHQRTQEPLQLAAAAAAAAAVVAAACSSGAWQAAEAVAGGQGTAAGACPCSRGRLGAQGQPRWRWQVAEEHLVVNLRPCNHRRDKYLIWY